MLCLIYQPPLKHRLLFLDYNIIYANPPWSMCRWNNRGPIQYLVSWWQMSLKNIRCSGDAPASVVKRGVDPMDFRRYGRGYHNHFLYRLPISPMHSGSAPHCYTAVQKKSSNQTYLNLHGISRVISYLDFPGDYTYYLSLHVQCICHLRPTIKNMQQTWLLQLNPN